MRVNIKYLLQKDKTLKKVFYLPFSHNGVKDASVLNRMGI